MLVSFDNMSFSFELKIFQFFIYSSSFFAYQHLFVQQSFSSQSFFSFMTFQSSTMSQNIQFQTMQQNFNQLSFEILSVQYNINDFERNIKFFKKFVNTNKVFHIFCTILKFVENKRIESIKLHKRMIQANQESNMNVIIVAFVRQLKLDFKFIDEIEFKEFSMKITNHNHIILYH